MKKQEILNEIQALRRQTPQAEQITPPHQLPEAKHDILIKHILDVFNATGLTAQQAKDLLVHLTALVELGERIAHRTTH